jgi:tripeptidyl-peptidase-1
MHVQTIAPTTAFASMRHLQQTPRSRSGGAVASGEPVDLLSRQVQYVSPSFLRLLYGTITYTPAATDRNVLGILALNTEYPSQEDLTAFLTKYRADARAPTFTSVPVKVPVNSGASGLTGPSTVSGPEPNLEASMMEVNLDIQYSVAIAYPTPVIYYTITPDSKLAFSDFFFEWFDYVLNQPSVPQTISATIVRLTPSFVPPLCGAHPRAPG